MHHDARHDPSATNGNEVAEDERNSLLLGRNKNPVEKQNKNNAKHFMFPKRKNNLPTRTKNGNRFNGDGANQCGPINLEAVQQVLAAKWAIDVINNQSLPHEIKIGKYIFIRCHESSW